jgi:hypothetical protein
MSSNHQAVRDQDIKTQRITVETIGEVYIRGSFMTCNPPNTIRAMKSSRWTGHVARMVDTRVAYRVFGGETRRRERESLARPRRRWNNIKIDL